MQSTCQDRQQCDELSMTFVILPFDDDVLVLSVTLCNQKKEERSINLARSSLYKLEGHSPLQIGKYSFYTYISHVKNLLANIHTFSKLYCHFHIIPMTWIHRNSFRYDNLRFDKLLLSPGYFQTRVCFTSYCYHLDSFKLESI